MDKFIVSARKYRPQNFSTVVGQTHITTTLKNAIRNNQLAHAFLFCGPRGVGKTTCARILGKTINCENPTPDWEACNECSSCVSFNEGSSLNIHELDAASNNTVDDIRTLVEQVRFAPQAAKYKIYIIDEVHMLSTSAFNAFLKTLEEPPPYAIFILATTEKHKILPTILSRCQIFDFKRISINDTVAHLREICDKEHIKADNASLQVIAQKSEGCMRDSLSILDKIVSFTNGEVVYRNTLEHLNILDEDYYFRMLEAMCSQDLAAAMLLYDDINRKGFEGDLVLNGFAEFMRNLLVCKDEKAAGLLEVVENFREKYSSTAKTTSASFIISALNVLNETEMSYKGARNKRLHVELALIKLCYLQQAINLNSAEPGNKKKLNEPAKAVSFRHLQPVYVQPKTGAEKPAARLIVQEPSKSEAVVERETKNKLPGQTQAEKKMATIATEPAKGTIGSLSKIRQQFINKQANAGDSVKPLSIDLLQQAWQEYTLQLQINKNSAFQSFHRAVLNITDANSFEVITNNNLEQKFIDQEKRNLSDFLQTRFNNRLLSFSILVSEHQPVEELPERTLSKRDQYLQMIEQYPLIKELKEKLKLELDY